METHKRTRLATGAFVFALLVSSCVFAVVMLYYFSSVSLDRLKVQSAATVSLVESYIREKTFALKSLASFAATYDDLFDPDLLFLLEQDAGLDEDWRMGISKADGLSRALDGTEIRTEGREYFSIAMTGKSMVTGPYISQLTGQCSTVVATPVIRNKEIVGVLRSTILCDTASLFLERLKLGDDVSIYMSTPTGKLLWDSGVLDKELFAELRESVPLENMDAVASMAADMRTGKNGFASLVLQGDERYVIYTRINTGDYVVVAMPGRFVFGSVQTVVVATLLFAVCAVLCVIFLFIYNKWVEKRFVGHIEAINKDLNILMDSTPGGICRVCPDARLTLELASDGFFALCGFCGTLMNHKGKGLADFLHPADAREFVESLRAALPEDLTQAGFHKNAAMPYCMFFSDNCESKGSDAGGLGRLAAQETVGSPVNLAVRLRRADGTVAWGLVHGQHRRYGQSMRFECVITDISELKQTQLELANQKMRLEELVQERSREHQQQAALLRHIFDALPQCIYYKDLNGIYQGCNRATEKFFDLPQSEIVGRSDEDLFSHDPHVVATSLMLVTKTMETRKPEHSEEVISLGDGQERIYESYLSVYGPQDSEFVGFIGIRHDVTLYKQAEQAHAEAKRAALEANDAKTAFLANISHEIRTPMNAILGLSHLLLQVPDMPAEARDRLVKLHGSARQLMGLINDILDFSKLESSKLLVEGSESILSDILAQVSDNIQARATEKGLQFVLEAAADLPAVVVLDGNRLTQILLNLCANGVKFTEQGTVKLVATVIRKSQAPWLKFSVTDTGVGIPQEKIGKVFDMFMQADESVVRKHGGTGLGLAICRQLAELMRGELSVQSEPGQGSEFVLLVPLCLPVSAMATVLEPLALGAMNGSEPEPGMDMVQAVREYDPASTSAKSEVLVLPNYFSDELNGEGVNGEGVKNEGGQIADPLGSWLVDLPQPSPLQGAWPEASLPEAARPAVDAVQTTTVEVGSDSDILSGKRVLVVEDNSINQEICVALLEIKGMTAEVAENGEVGLRMAEANHYDIILMDMQMPVMGGLESVKCMRANEKQWLREVPILAMTAHATAADRNKSLAAGMNDHITKPLDVDVLYTVMAYWLRVR